MKTLNRGVAAAVLVMLAGGCGMVPSWTSADAPEHSAAARPRSATAGNTGNEEAGVAAMSLPRASAPGERGDLALATGTQTTDEADSTVNVSRTTFAEEGADFDPCPTPDGTRVVFASTAHRKTADLYVKRTDGRVVTQLTNDPAEDAMPSVSPDGTRVAFASNRGGNWDIYVMPIGGGKAVRVTDDAADEIHPSWSPDGERLVFSRFGESSGRWEMWVSSVRNSGTSTFVGFGLLPRWCPVAGTGENGADQILFQQARERGGRTFGVWTLDVADGKAANATEIAGSATTALINPTWSPDGQWIVYAEIPAWEANTGRNAARPSRATSGALWMVSARGEGRVRLTSGQGGSLSPVWGSGDRLFFVSGRTGKDNIWSLDMGPAVASARATLQGTTDFASVGTNMTSGGGTPQAERASRADNNPVATAGEDGPSDPR
jgi:TolB protein